MNIRHAVKKSIPSVVRFLLILIISLLINAVVLTLVGKDPITTYSRLFGESLIGVWSIAKTLRWFTSLMLCGISAAIAFNGEVLNLGIDGQLYMGAITATATALYLGNLPGFILIPLCILTAMLAGALWSAIAGWLNVRFGSNIIVVTLMLNYLATLFTNWCILYPMYTPEGAAAKASLPIPDHARLSLLIPGTQVSTAIFIVIFIWIATYIWLKYTKSGFEVRVMGHNPNFARIMGININRKKMLLMGMSGAVAGLCGAVEILGMQHRFAIGFTSGMGFNGMVISMLVGNNIAGLPLGGFFMAVIQSGSSALEMFANIPRSMVSILMGVIILFVTVKFSRIKLFKKKNAK